MGAGREKSSGGRSRTDGAVIRPAVAGDTDAIREIYNHYVETSTATFDLKQQTAGEAVDWFESHQRSGLPVIVAEEDGRVAGWASLSFFHNRCGYSQTVEPSIYIRPGHHRRGLGLRLTSELMVEAEKYHCLIAYICSENQASINLIKKFGFREIGILKEVGRKFDRWLDVTVVQRVIE